MIMKCSIVLKINAPSKKRAVEKLPSTSIYFCKLFFQLEGINDNYGHTRTTTEEQIKTEKRKNLLPQLAMHISEDSLHVI